MELSLLERIMITNMRPSTGRFEDMIIRKDVLNKVAVKQDEIKTYDVRSLDSGGIQWNEAGATYTITVELTEMEKNFIQKTLKKVSDDEKLPAECVDLYKKFNQF